LFTVRWTKLLIGTGEVALAVRRTVSVVATEDCAILQVIRNEVALLELPPGGLRVTGLGAGHDSLGVAEIGSEKVDAVVVFWLVFATVAASVTLVAPDRLIGSGLLTLTDTEYTGGLFTVTLAVPLSLTDGYSTKFPLTVIWAVPALAP
jgi:hypothetical protein